MAFWRRGADQQQAQDPIFSFFTEEEGARFRMLAQQEFAGAGVEGSPEGDALVGVDGQRFGLFNLAAACHAAGSRETAWRALINQHVVTVTSFQPRGLDEASPDEVLRGAFLQLIGSYALQQNWHDHYSYARQPAEDLVEILVVEMPGHLLTLDDAIVKRVGERALRAAAREHLLAVPIQSHEVVEDAGGTVHVVEGDSVFTASKLLVMEDLLRRTIGDQPRRYGAIVGVPFRHQLVFSVVQDSAAAAVADSLADHTARAFMEEVGGVSPCIYWWRPSGLIPLTMVTSEGYVEGLAPDEFIAVMNELGALR